MNHHHRPMPRKLVVHVTLRGSASLSYGAVAGPATQALDHEQLLGRRNPANTGRRVLVSR